MKIIAGSKEFNVQFHLGDKKKEMSSSANGDPHFTQIVFDEKTGKSHKICYDVTGKKGEKINIINFVNKNISIFGELMDDYYMHKIKIQQEKFLSYFDVYGFYLNNKKKEKKIQFYSWNEIFREKQINFFQTFKIISLKKNICKIIFNKMQEIIKVEKITRNLNSQYLNIQIENLNKNYHKLDGLIGYVGNLPLTFFNQIQNPNSLNSPNSQQVFIQIRDEIKIAKQIQRDKQNCILIQFNHLIQPKFRHQFIF